MHEIPYKRYLYELLALAVAWGVFATAKCQFDNWTITDVANWSQAVSVFELVIAFVLALMSDQRILSQFQVERRAAKIEENERRLAICKVYKRRFLLTFGGGFLEEDTLSFFCDGHKYAQRHLAYRPTANSKDFEILICQYYMLLPAHAQYLFDNIEELFEDYNMAYSNLLQISYGMANSPFVIIHGPGKTESIKADHSGNYVSVADTMMNLYFPIFQKIGEHLYIAFKDASKAIESCIKNNGEC